MKWDTKCVLRDLKIKTIKLLEKMLNQTQYAQMGCQTLKLENNTEAKIRYKPCQKTKYVVLKQITYMASKTRFKDAK